MLKFEVNILKNRIIFMILWEKIIVIEIFGFYFNIKRDGVLNLDIFEIIDF